MGATANLANELQTIESGMDSVVIRKYGAGIIGGRTLDVSNVASDVIKAGHVIIRSTTDETDYKPMPVKDGAYDTLTTGYEYAEGIGKKHHQERTACSHHVCGRSER